MSNGTLYLHSHSGIERENKFPKHIVLVDEKFKDLFSDGAVDLASFKYRGNLYYKVPILQFINKGGIFKNLDK